VDKHRGPIVRRIACRQFECGGIVAMIRSIMPVSALLALIAAAASPASAQPDSGLQTFFTENVGLSQAQIAAIGSGEPVAKTLPARTPAEVFLFGAVYIQALRNLTSGWSTISSAFAGSPVIWRSECSRNLPNFRTPMAFRSTATTPGHYGSASQGLPDPDACEHHRRAPIERLLAYQREGNRALGVYNDKRDPTEVSRQFAYLLSYEKALPERLPDFYRYLLAYPDAKPANVEDTFYWARVKFGLKPTLRIVHVVTMRGNPAGAVAYAIAEKQLYASHYFETALDLSFCVRAAGNPKRPGFYLIMDMGSEQAGLTGVQGFVVRKAAVGRSVSSLRDALATIKNVLEGNQ
jgi:hypothetical protein